MRKNWKKHLAFITMLSVVPIIRELFFGVISHHHTPFASTEDILHTGLEVLFMLLMACMFLVLSYFHNLKTSREIQLTQTVSIEALACLAEYRDAETSQHLQRIRKFVEILTKAMLNTPQFKDYLRQRNSYLSDIANASVLHDIGKIAIPDAILLKPDSLTPEEFDAVKQHTLMGCETLGAANRYFKERIGNEGYLALAESIARSHHEKWDGSGYPDGLKGEEIPLAARITAICDVYDAVTSDRVYKKAWSHEKALAMIQESRGVHFDPHITDIFLAKSEEIRAVKNHLT